MIVNRSVLKKAGLSRFEINALFHRVRKIAGIKFFHRTVVSDEGRFYPYLHFDIKEVASAISVLKSTCRIDRATVAERDLAIALGVVGFLENCDD